jgi:hypothetical protein
MVTGQAGPCVGNIVAIPSLPVYPLPHLGIEP